MTTEISNAPGPTSGPHPTMQAAPLADAERRAIDQSTRGPVLLFVAAAATWLVAASLLQLIASVKLVLPGFLDFADLLTYGRVQPAAVNAFVYGWASQAGMAIGIWMTARLCRVPLVNHALLISGALIWNLGVLIGVLAILGGGGTSIEFLDFPGVISPVLLLAYLLISVWAIVMFHARRPGAVYVSQWYLLAAFLAFPWLYATASLLLVWWPVPGSASGPIHWWFGNGLIGLWLMSLAFAALYYFVPRAAGRPVFSYGLANIGFWTFLFFVSWSGMSRLIGGPVPVWLVSASVAATVLLVIPMAAVAANLRLTIGEGEPLANPDGAMKFFGAGFTAYALFTLMSALTVFPSANSVLQFTMLTPGLIDLSLYGFVTLVFFGSFYVIVPRLVGHAWSFPDSRPWVLWLAVTGIGLVFSAAVFGGLTQGFALADPGVTALNAVQFADPFRWVVVVGYLIMFVANKLFAATFAWNLLGPATMTAPVVREVRVPAEREAAAV